MCESSNLSGRTSDSLRILKHMVRFHVCTSSANIRLISEFFNTMLPSSIGLGQQLFKLLSGVRFPVGAPFQQKQNVTLFMFSISDFSLLVIFYFQLKIKRCSVAVRAFPNIIKILSSCSGSCLSRKSGFCYCFCHRLQKLATKQMQFETIMNFWGVEMLKFGFPKVSKSNRH